MNRVGNLIIGTVSLFAFSALPLQWDVAGIGSLDLSSAYAKGDKGGGNGNGGGNGGGRGNGGGNGHADKGGGKGHADKGGKGKSASAQGHSKSHFGKDKPRGSHSVAKNSSAKVKTAKAGGRGRVQQAALPSTMAAPELKSNFKALKTDFKEKNLNAKLAGLNSLNRNYHAYLNSQSPRMASIQAFVMDSVEFDIAQAKLDAANVQLAASQAEFESLVAGTELTPYDGAVGIYDDPSLADLRERLDHLNSVTVAPEDEAAWAAEVAALESILDSAEAAAFADAQQAAADAQAAADEAAVGTDDEALREALLDAANENRVEQYGDDYIDDEIMDWAKDVLGVGDDFGKIDEVRESLEAGGD
jgi:hypothetical protein